MFIEYIILSTECHNYYKLQGYNLEQEKSSLASEDLHSSGG